MTSAEAFFVSLGPGLQFPCLFRTIGYYYLLTSTGLVWRIMQISFQVIKRL